ncbi:MAG: hypothetical protein H7222_13205 [Methylotenera sp.]|nr:hypothetical protein [Oligoflexia bacterium]
MTNPDFDSIALARRIPGWGADLRPENRPGVPKEKVPDNGTGAHWEQPEQQITSVRIFKTIERPEVTPVFGTTCAPKGLSGVMRTAAYRLGEGKISRWVTLLLADRVDMFESILLDVIKGRAGNPFSEMGLGTEFRNRREKGFMPRGWYPVIAVGIVGLFAASRAVHQQKEKKRFATFSDEFKKVA